MTDNTRSAGAYNIEVLSSESTHDDETTIRIDITVPRSIALHPHSYAFYERLAEAGLLHASKQQDYGKTTDPFANVRSSQDWGMAPWVGAMVRLNDKVKRLQMFAQRGDLANESAEDSMLDISVYALIALVLYGED